MRQSQKPLSFDRSSPLSSIHVGHRGGQPRPRRSTPQRGFRRNPVRRRIPSRSAWPRAIPLPTESCSGRVWRRGPPSRRAWGIVTIPVRWRVGTDHSPALRRRPGRGPRPPRARAFGSRGSGRPAPGPRLLLPVRRGPRGEPGRALPHCPREERVGASAPLRFRDLPGLAQRLLHGVPRHAEAGPRHRPAPRRLHLRVRHLRHHGARHSRAGRLRRGDGGPPDLSAAAHAVQARSRPAGRAREVPLRRDLGRPRGRERLLGPRPRIRARPRRSSRRGGPPPTRPTTSTCPSAPRSHASRATTCASIAGSSSAGSPSSPCSTTASTGPTTPAETAKRFVARRP